MREFFVNLRETMEWQRVNGAKIAYLADQGDGLAKRLIQAYRDLYEDRLNPYRQAEFMAVADDVCRRFLTLTTRTILSERYGVNPPKTLKRLDS